MKKLALTALFAAGLAIVASAAVTTGIDIGYLTRNKDAMWSGRVGWEFKTDSSLSHQVELEYGYTEHSETLVSPAPLLISGTQKTKLQPLTINYRAETTPADKLGYYFGAGLGESRVSLTAPGSGVPSITGSDSAFTIQTFGGMSYQITPNAILHVGLKYLWINSATVFGGLKVKTGNDLALTAGLSAKF